jgi:uncharacterized protein with FMN-binding domain
MTSTPYLRTAATALGAVALLGTVAACATATGTTTTDAGSGTTATTTTTAPSSASTAASSGSSTYKDGEYTASGQYQSPNGTESITVDLTIADDKVTAVTVTGTPSGPDATNYQSQFESNIASIVVGQDISTLSVSKVAGSSLTSAGFNAAVDSIKSQAAA